MADDAKLIAVVEANTKQFENALKRLEKVTKSSTDQMTNSVKKLDASFAGVGKRAASLAGVFGRSFASGFGATAVVRIISQIVKMNDELREQGLISKETFEQVDELGRAWGRAGAAMKGAAAEGVSLLSGTLTVAGDATTLFLQDVTLLLEALQKLKDGKWSEGLDLLNKGIASAAAAAERISGAFDAASGAGGAGASSVDQAARLIAKEEGFRSKAYWDVNAWRIGFGSDTMTKPTGVFGVNAISKVTASSTVDVADAMRDLSRRIVEFQHIIEKQIGPDIFKALTPGAQAALTSVAYNYGRLPGSVVTAAKTLDTGAIASSIMALPANPERRAREARVALGDTPAGDVLEEQIKAKEKQIEEQKQAAEKAAKESKEAEEKELKRLNDLEEERNQLVFDRALKSGEVTDEMKKQTDAIGDSMAFNRDLVGGFIQDLEHGVKPAEALANALQKVADRLLDIALNAIFPDVGGGIIGAITGLAGGGVMTSRGPMPLRRYAGGGVANSPQLAMFGEGSRPEAYVPLPDGRRIPVNIRMPGMGGLGGGRGGQAVAVHNRVTVDPSPLFITTTHAVARQGGRDAVVEAGDHSRRRPGGR